MVSMRHTLRARLLGGAGLAAAIVLAATLAPWGTPAAQAADDDPLVIYSRAGSIEAFTGLNGVVSTAVRNNTTTDLDDVYISYEPTVAGSGMTLPGPGAGFYYDPSCAQPAGAGTTVICGPVSIAAGRTGGHSLAYDVPSDFLLVHGNGPTNFGTIATAASEKAGFESPGYLNEQKARSDVYLQATMALVDAGAPKPTRPRAPSNARFSGTSPQDRDLQLIVTHGGFSDIRDVHIAITLPEGLELRRLPDNCTRSGSTIDCVWALAKSGTFATITLPVRISPDLPAGHVIPLLNPAVEAIGPNEPEGVNNVWTASVIGGPFSLVIEPSVDLAISGTMVEPLTAGARTSFPVAIANHDGRNAAVNARARFALDGVGVAGTSIDIPGCKAVDPKHIECALVELAAGTTLTGSITTTLPAVSSPTDFTLSGTVSSDTPEINPADNSFSTAYTLLPKAAPVDPVSPADPGDPPAPAKPAPAGGSAPTIGVGVPSALAMTGQDVHRALALAIVVAATGVYLFVRGRRTSAGTSPSNGRRR